MSNDEFTKIWTLMTSLWPAAAAKKNKINLAVWKKGLADFTMQDVSDRVMSYAKSSKFFPDLADITKGLEPIRVTQDAVERAILNNAKVYAKAKRIKAPEFANGAEAMAWFREMETGA